MLEKNMEISLEITAMTLEGNGIGRFEGMAVFVPNTAVGDQLKVKIVKVLKHYAFGIISEMIKPSESRIEPKCTVCHKCGGCVFQHISYEAELKIKEQAVKDCFERLGGIATEGIFDTIAGSERQIRYRNKAQYPVAKEKGRTIFGFFAPRSHRVISVQDCQLQPAVFSEIAEKICALAEHYHISVYDEKNHSGWLRHIYLRQGAYSGDIMLCVVVRKDIRKNLMPLVEQMVQQYPEIKSVVMNINPERTNVILGRKTCLLYGKESLSDTMCGVDVQLAPEAFYQVNTLQAERLYGIAKAFASLKKEDVLLDLYCGVGIIGLSMAKEVKQLIGVEVVPEAIENAKKNAENGGYTNARFEVGDAGTIAEKLVQEQLAPDVVIVDPPRKGCDEKTLSSIVKMAPNRVVMISCNPSTASRDTAILVQNGYQVQKIQPVDLFPRTSHVECVVLLTRQ